MADNSAHDQLTDTRRPTQAFSSQTSPSVSHDRSLPQPFARKSRKCAQLTAPITGPMLRRAALPFVCGDTAA